MIGFLTGIGAKAWAYVGIAVAVLAGLAKVFYAGKKEAQVEGMQEQLKNVETRDKVETALTAVQRSELKRLRTKWERPK